MTHFQHSYGKYPDLSKVKKILIVKMRHHGDVLLTSPLFSVLKNALPQVEIDAYINKETYPMLEGHPAISHFHLYDRKSKSLSLPKKLAKEASLLKQIRRSNYDMVINLTEGDRGAMAAFVSGAAFKIGYDTPGKKGIFKKKLYTQLVKLCTTPRHTVEQHLDVARKLGIFPMNEEKELFFHIPENAFERTRNLLEQNQIDEYVHIHPVSRWLFKCPPANNIAEWVKRLHAAGKKIVMTAGPDKQEMAMVEKILSLAPGVPVLNLAGKISLKELGALIKMSSCLLCVDSVPLHLASALKTPVVVVFGPSVETIWGPWMNPKSRVITHPISCRPCGLDGCGGSKMSDCLTLIKPESVVNAVLSFI